MKERRMIIMVFGILIADFVTLSAFDERPDEMKASPSLLTIPGEPLQKAAFEILNQKCNGCHRRRNPWMIFNEKNMVKRAPKIYDRVFVQRTMPKGDEVRLSVEEAATLKKWLFTQKIY